MKAKKLISFLISFVLLGIVNSVSGQPTQNYCQSFNGGQALMLTNNAALDLGNTFTIETWVFLQIASPGAIILGKTLNPPGNDPWQNYVLSFDGLKPAFIQTTGMSGSYRTATAPDDISLNTWTHIAGTLGAGQMKLYVNGNLVATSASPGNPIAVTDIPFSIGTEVRTSHEVTCCGVRGAIKQARVWNQELTQANIQSNMNNQLTGNEAGLIGCWPMNDSTGQSITDITSNANHLMRGADVNSEDEDPVAVLNSNVDCFSFIEIILHYNPNGTEEMFVVDFNADSLKDIIAARIHWPPTIPASYAPMQCLKNNGSLFFSDDFPLVGVDSLVHPRDHIVADFNGDNRSDIFIADHGTDTDPCPGGQNRLYLQNSNGQLIESSDGNIPIVLDFSHNTAAADIDNDGDQDIYVCNIWGHQGIGPRLLINNGSGQFTVNTSNLPENIANLTNVYMSSRFVDIDRDGDQDLILGGVSILIKDAILINDGKGSFSISDGLPNRYGGPQWGTVSMAVIEINNDGWPDLIMSTTYEYSICHLQLLINNRDGTFSDSTQNIPQNWSASDHWIKWIEPADFNNDGWEDFVVCEFTSPAKLFLNEGNTKFIDASPLLNQVGSGSFRARDFDNDGFTDIAFFNTSNNIAIAKNMKPCNLGITPFSKPGKPIVLSPKDGNIVDKSSLFTWEPNGITTNFQLQVSRNAGFTDIVYERKQVTTTDSSRVNLAVIGTLYWRIRGTNTAGTGEWSDAGRFITQNQVPAEILLSSASINESNGLGTAIGVFKTVDPDEGDKHTYSFAQGNGTNDADNGKFSIAGDTLKTNTTFNTDVLKYLHINVQSDDGDGGKVIRQFIIFLEPAELIAYYPFNGNVNDESGNNHHGTLQGAMLTTERNGIENHAYYFNGTGDKIMIGTGLSLINNTENFSLTAWIYPEELSAGYQHTILAERDGGNNFQFAILDHLLYFSYWSSGSEYMFSGSEIPLNQWSFVAVTYDGQNIRLFINGQPDKTFSASGKIDNNYSTLNLGCLNGTDGCFKGNLDDIAIYSKTLSSAEIQQLFIKQPSSNISLSNAAIKENQPTGAVVGFFSAIDPDTGNTHAYALVDGTGSEGNNSFTIQDDTLYANMTFDFDVQNSYSIRVRTNDVNNGNLEKIFNISITKLEGIESNNLEIENIRIYPQPSMGIIFIESLNSIKRFLFLQVYNIHGAVVYHKICNNTSRIEQIDLSSCPKGMYFLKIISNKGTLSSKILIN